MKKSQQHSLTFASGVPFTQIPNCLIRNPNISGAAKALYAYMVSRGDGWKFYVSEIQQNMKEGRDKIYSCLQELEDHKYLQRYRNKAEDGTFGPTSYKLFHKPYTEMTDTDSPYTENTDNKNKECKNKENTIKRKTASYLPEDFLGSEDYQKFFKYGVEQDLEVEYVESELKKFFNYWTSLGSVARARKSDWFKTWQNWVANSIDYRRKSRPKDSGKRNGLFDSLKQAKGFGYPECD